MSYYQKGQILEITQGGAISKGSIVTVSREYTIEMQKKGETVSCNYDGSTYEVTLSHLSEVKDPMWRSGQKAKIVYGGALSVGTEVEIKEDFSTSDLRKGNSVKCDYKGEIFLITPYHLGR